MAKLNSLFDEFLSNIEPDKKAKSYAQDAHKPVRECLEKDEKFKDYFEGSFLYGSYRRHTAVGDIKDVDIVVLTNFDPEQDTPQSVLRKLKAALGRCYDDPENPQYQRRSIRIDDPLPDEPDVTMTLDIIPAVAVDGDDNPLRVPDREAKEWVWSHPKGHLQYTTDFNNENVSEGRYVPLVKMMKWWWKYQCSVRQPDEERPKPKGFWVECLTGENFDAEQHDWADHFIAVLEQVSKKYADATEVPELQDPGLADSTIKTSMTQDEFTFFMDVVSESLEQAQKARDEEDEVASSEMWRELFGEEFPLYDEEETKETKTQARIVPVGSTAHMERLRWPLDLNNHYRVRIDTYTYFAGQRLSGINSAGRTLPSGIELKYVAKTNVPKPYEVFWRVVNTGPHAAQENALRGGFFGAKKGSAISGNPLINWESTKYTGRHWIECLIIKNGRCVARSNRFYVIVKNPNF